MRKKLNLWLSLLIVFLTLLCACRQEDLAASEKRLPRNTSDFFKHSKKGTALAKAGVDYVEILEAYNREKDFLSTMPDQKGMPIWEKMKIADTQDATGLIIPLSFDNESLSSLLFVILDSENIVKGTNNITNEHLKDIVYNADYSKTLREKLMNNFIMMDYEVFGNDFFGNIPEDLYADQKIEGNRLVYGGNQGNLTNTLVQDEINRMMIIDATTCTTIYHCTHHGSGSCDHCSKCETTTCTTNSIPIFINEGTDFPTGGDIPAGGGGGTGTGGSPTNPGPGVPKDPCASATVFYRLNTGCLAMGGEIGLPNINPCDKTKAIYNNTAVKSRYEILKGKTSEPSESGYGFKTVPDGNGGTTTQTNPLNPDTNPDKMKVGIYPTSYGYIHTHLDKTNGKMAVKIFSPADINTFLAFLHNAQTNGIPFGSIFGGMIASDPDTGHNIYQMIYTGDGTDLPAELTDDQLKAFKNWYRDEAKQMVNNNEGVLSHSDMQKLFYATLKKMNMKNIVLSKIEYNTTTYKIVKFDANENPTEETCP